MDIWTGQVQRDLGGEGRGKYCGQSYGGVYPALGPSNWPQRVAALPEGQRRDTTWLPAVRERFIVHLPTFENFLKSGMGDEVDAEDPNQND